MHYKGKPTLLFCFGIAPRLPTAAAAPSLVSAASAPLVQLPPSSRQLRVVGQTRSHTPAPRIGASLHPTLPMYVCSSEICRNQDHVFAYLSPRVNGRSVLVTNKDRISCEEGSSHCQDATETTHDPQSLTRTLCLSSFVTEMNTLSILIPIYLNYTRIS